MRFPLAALALAWLPPVGAQTGPPPEPSPEAMLATIRRNVRENLERLPNYTCRLTIERYRKAGGQRHATRVDTVHLEVGYVDRQELYAWPGQKFENRRLEQIMPPGGAVGNGDFALHARAIFMTNDATFTYAGRGEEDGRLVVRFDYRIEQKKSRYALSDGEATAMVPYHGSFWADAGSLQLIRLEVQADDVPSKIRIRGSHIVLTYAPARIGGADFLLPQSSDLLLTDTAKNESRNLTRFEQCRQYQGESVMSFVDPTSVPEAHKTVTEIRLPAGLLMEMILRTELNLDRAVIGDPIAAVVAHDIVREGAVVIPKGATVTGRITRIGQTMTGRIQYHTAGIRLTSVEFGDRHADLTASLESFAYAAAQITVSAGSKDMEPGEGLLFVRGNVTRIPPGAHMFWRTLPNQK